MDQYATIWSAKDRERAFALQGAGHNMSQIGLELGRSAESVRSFFRRHRRRGRGGAPELSYGPCFEVPARRSNDHAKHLRLTFGARSEGFPVLNLPATYRVAA